MAHQSTLTPSCTSKSPTSSRYILTNKSSYFVLPETNEKDSEKSAVKIVQAAIESQIAAIGTPTPADYPKMSSAILAALKKEEAALGLEFSLVEFRGSFDASHGVPDKIRALELPHPDFEGPGHDLANDYWEVLMTPPFFTKMTYGSKKTPLTPAAVSLEWSVPSPPDFHHFNEVRVFDVGSETVCAACGDGCAQVGAALDGIQGLFVLSFLVKILILWVKFNVFLLPVSCQVKPLQSKRGNTSNA